MTGLLLMASVMHGHDVPRPVAVVSVTGHGSALALKLTEALPQCRAYVPTRHGFAVAMGAEPYTRLRDLFPRLWSDYRALVCIMAAGIVVRCIAPLVRSKTQDPAVVVLDERGRFAISLLSGHVGGANRLAQVVAEVLGGQAVITTGSDVARKPAVDVMAMETGLVMEDMTWAARVTSAILDEDPLWVYDPDGRLGRYRGALSGAVWMDAGGGSSMTEIFEAAGVDPGELPGLWVSECEMPASCRAVVLRPRCLAVGVGCNRNTSAEEIMEAIRAVFREHGLALGAVRALASVDVKANEPGLQEAARKLGWPVAFFPSHILRAQRVPNPSPVVRRCIGVSSVCEAAALMASRNGRLIVEKQKSLNVTVAVAKDGSGS